MQSRNVILKSYFTFQASWWLSSHSQTVKWVSGEFSLKVNHFSKGSTPTGARVQYAPVINGRIFLIPVIPLVEVVMIFYVN